MPKCPICKKTDLQLIQHDNQPPVSECSTCGGMWVRANEYASWLKTQTPGKYDLTNAEEASKRFPITDSHQAAICPDCGHFLRKYKVSSNFDFQLDRCNNCNGVWLDKNEWQVLQATDLQDEINKIFTQPWQKQILDEITARKFEAMYLERFGESDYAKIKEVRNWLQEHPNRNILIAYLLDKDPYSA
jgi:Zn-finger nucleic acid-binding protein